MKKANQTKPAISIGFNQPFATVTLDSIWKLLKPRKKKKRKAEDEDEDEEG